MGSWVARVLRRVHEAAALGRVRLTLKAEQEACGLGLAPEDARDVLAALGHEEDA